MNISDFLKASDCGTHLLFSDKVSVGNALVRRANICDGITAWNVECKTVEDVAKELIYANKAMEDANLDVSDISEEANAISYLSDAGERGIMFNILMSGKYSTFPESTLSMETIIDVLKCVNELRLNGTTEAFEAASQGNTKIKELLEIKDSLEEALKSHNYYDKARAVAESIELMNSLRASGDISQILPWAKDVLIGVVETSRFSKKEWEFIDLFADICGVQKISNKIEFFSNPQLEEHFVSAYGIANEVRYVVEQIEDVKNEKVKLNPGSVEVYYSSPVYLNYLRAAFDVAKIPYYNDGGRPAAELELTRFPMAILASAKEDYSYEKLENAVKCRCVTFKNVTEGAECGSPNRYYYKGTNAGIGWGKERYDKFYKACMLDEKKTDLRVFAKFLMDFVLVFNKCVDDNKDNRDNKEDKTYPLSQIWTNLWEFTKKYTYKRNPEKTYLSRAFAEKANELKELDLLNMDINQKIDYLYETLASLKISEKEEDGVVKLTPINGISVMERPNIFVLGLEAASFSLDDKQSPVLTDKEKREYLLNAGDDSSSVELSSEKNAIRIADLKNSLRTICSSQEGKFSKIVYLYNRYDTVNLRENVESIFFNERRNGKEPEEASGYEKWESFMGDGYNGKDKFKIIADDLAKVAAKRKKEIEEADKKKPTAKKEEAKMDKADAAGNDSKADSTNSKDDEYKNVSASGLQMLLKCPLQYYYQYIKHLRVSEQLTPKGHEWLGAIKKGNLFHYFAEEYMEKAVPPEASISETIDEDLFKKCYETALDKVLDEQPFLSEDVYEREKEYYRDLIHGYIEALHKKWKEDADQGKSWKIIKAELEFGNGRNDTETDANSKVDVKLNIKGNTPLEPECKLNLNGSIDRMDAYLDQTGILKLRIIDYKTGKLDQKEKEIEEGVQIQHIIYVMAAKEYLKSEVGKNRIKELFSDELQKLGIDEPKGFEFEYVGYDFPYEKKDKIQLDKTEVSKDGVLGEEILNTIYQTIGKWQQGKADDVQRKLDGIEKCTDEKYCNFSNICRICLKGRIQEDEEDSEE